jgi:hypothetical protein
VTAARRILIPIGLAVAVTVAASAPASATYADVAAVPTTIATGTVAAPAAISVNDSCTTTTTVVRRTVYTNPGTGEQIQTAYSSTTTYAASTSNVQGATTTTVAGPGPNETTTTTTTKNTDLSVTASWAASGSKGVSGYLVTAHLNNGTTYAMAQTTPGVLTTSAGVDADYLSLQPRLSVTTLTTYGWTATTAQTPVLSC